MQGRLMNRGHMQRGSESSPQLPKYSSPTTWLLPTVLHLEIQEIIVKYKRPFRGHMFSFTTIEIFSVSLKIFPENKIKEEELEREHHYSEQLGVHERSEGEERWSRALKTNYTDFTILSPAGTHYLYSIGGGQVTRSNDFSSHKDPGSHSESGQRPTIGGEHQTKSSHIPREPHQVSGPRRGRGNHQPLRSAIHLPAITMDVEARWPSHPLTRQVEPTLNTPPSGLSHFILRTNWI